MLKWLLHLGCIASFGWTIYWDLYILDIPTQKSFGGQWKYLTFINLWIQLTYFIVSFLNNIFGSFSKDKLSSSGLQRVRDYYFATLAFPIGQFVGIIFWTLWHINRELVFPKAFDSIFPSYINHLMHTVVIPAQLLELYLSYHIYPSRWMGIATSCMFCFGYLIWILIVAAYGGIWVYPILKVLDPVPKAAFMIGCSLFGAVLYIIGEIMNRLIWGNPSQQDEPSVSQSKQSKGKAKKPQKAE